MEQSDHEVLIDLQNTVEDIKPKLDAMHQAFIAATGFFSVGKIILVTIGAIAGIAEAIKILFARH